MQLGRTVPPPAAGDRTSKGVFWRAPSPFQRRFRDSAKDLHISQNAYLTTAAIFGELVLKRRPEGKPENLLRLVEMMNAAVRNQDHLVMDACHESDWVDLEGFIGVLQDANVVGGLRIETRGDFAEGMILYAFALTRDGTDVWKRVGNVMLAVLAAEKYGDVERLLRDHAVS